MRYYSIKITDPDTGALIRPKSLASLNLPATYTSLIGGKNNPGALNVELDIPVVAYATPMGPAYVRIWGISIDEIGQATELNGKSIQVYAGMQKGLPLANPAQSGLIIQGTVQQAFGNWIGTDMTLDLVLQPSTGAPGDAKNIVLNWTKGTKLSDAIAQTLSVAFPGYQQNININPNLVFTQDEPGYYESLVQFAQYIKGVSQSIIGGNYAGVDIRLTETTFNVYDGTSQTAPIQIDFKDMIGQPTWLGFAQIQVTCVMRADLKVGDYIKLPPAVATTTAQSFSQYRAQNQSVFQGVFQINQIRHVGNFRQPDASAWVTTIDAFPAAA